MKKIRWITIISGFDMAFSHIIVIMKIDNGYLYDY